MADTKDCEIGWVPMDDPGFEGERHPVCFTHGYSHVAHPEAGKCDAVAEPKIQVITNARFACEFGPSGICATHRTSIMEHGAILTEETMTIEEAKKRFPDTDPKVWERLSS